MELDVGGRLPSQIPDRPPLTNSETTPSAHSIGVVNWMRERHRLASQLKTFTAEAR